MCVIVYTDAMSFVSTALEFLKTKWGIALIVAVVLGGGWWVFGRGSGAARQFVTVTQGAITETVSVTGNTTPIHSVALAFGTGGTVQNVYASVGDHVSAGALLASLNTSDLTAQLQQAQASVDAQTAKLAGLQAGSRPEDIASAKAAYDKSVQDLANLYASVSDVDTDAYAKANDAVRTQLSAFFSNADTDSVTLTFSTSNFQTQTDSQSGRFVVGQSLNAWYASLPALSTDSETQVDAAIQDALRRLGTVSSFLNTVGTAVNSATNLGATTAAAYKADVVAALTEVNTAIKNLNTVAQNISSQKLTVAQLNAQYQLKQAGSTSQDIAAQQAEVENAQASVASINAKLQNAKIIAPISGVVTQFDAKAGQIATAGATLVSIISDQSFEVDADVPEIDIGKVSVGDAVSMTLDAFPNETFTGKVFYIDPAETLTQGVVNYKVKVSFDSADSRMKSGLTTNLDIETAHKDNVLILPLYAVLQNDQGTFVEVMENGAVVNKPVTLGLEDQKGNAEITSGVTAGEQVLNIGLK